KFDGHELPADINAITKASASALAGHGLMGGARDSYPRDGVSKSYVAGFAEVEVDLEILDAPHAMDMAALDIPDPETPVGLHMILTALETGHPTYLPLQTTSSGGIWGF